MIFRDAFPQQNQLNSLEHTFKLLHTQFPERNLQLPHSSEYLSDILKLAAQRSGRSFPNQLLESRLEEDSFFSERIRYGAVPPSALSSRLSAFPFLPGGCLRR